MSAEGEESRLVRIADTRKIMLERDEEREKGNFVKCDILRDRLKEMGVEVFDQKGGPSGWKFMDGTSKKLPAGSNAVMPSRKRAAEDKDSTDAPAKKTKLSKKDARAASRESPSSTAKITEPPLAKKAAKPTKPSAETERNKAALNLVTGANAHVTNIQGVLIEDLKVGDGKKAESGKKVKVYYSGKLKTTGKVFDASLQKPFAFRLGRSEVIKGWDLGVAGMCVGGKRRITCPPEKAYGRVGAPPTIPPNSTLIFDVTLLDVL